MWHFAGPPLAQHSSGSLLSLAVCQAWQTAVKTTWHKVIFQNYCWGYFIITSSVLGKIIAMLFLKSKEDTERMFSHIGIMEHFMMSELCLLVCISPDLCPSWKRVSTNSWGWTLVRVDGYFSGFLWITLLLWFTTDGISGPSLKTGWRRRDCTWSTASDFEKCVHGSILRFRLI